MERHPIRGRTIAAGVAALAGSSLLVLPGATVTAEAATPPCGTSPSSVFVTCLFHDDFSGTALSSTALDSTKWVKINSNAVNKSTVNGNCLRSGQVTVGSGQLHITSEILESPMTCWGFGTSAATTRLVGGSLTTKGKFSHTYGRIEFRAKFPDATLSSTALWMHADQNTYNAGGPIWPYNGEIDIAERVWYAPNTIATSLHYADKSGATSYTTGDGNPGETLTSCTISTPEAFHTYSAEWTSTRVRFYVDNVMCGSLTWDPANVTPPAPFDHAFNLIATQTAIGTNATPAAGSVRTTHLDWVKVWSN